MSSTSWFLSAAQFALRYWPPETLASLIHDSTRVKVSGGPVEKQLALDVFLQAAEKAKQYCETEGLVNTLWQVSAGRSMSNNPVQDFSPESEIQPQASDSSRIDGRAYDLPALSCDQDDATPDSDHFAHPRHKRIEIVRRYWLARDNRDIKNKDAWARSRYQISGKTLLCYEREFQDQRQAILAASNGG